MKCCTQCELRDMEGEDHLLLKCLKYWKLINIYIPIYYSINSSITKYVQLMADLQNNLSFLVMYQNISFKPHNSNEGVL